MIRYVTVTWYALWYKCPRAIVALCRRRRVDHVTFVTGHVERVAMSGVVVAVFIFVDGPIVYRRDETFLCINNRNMLTVSE